MTHLEEAWLVLDPRFCPLLVCTEPVSGVGRGSERRYFYHQSSLCVSFHLEVVRNVCVDFSNKASGLLVLFYSTKGLNLIDRHKPG